MIETADIFIPTLNRIHSLKRCLESLNKQTIKNFRIILVGKEKNKEIRNLIKSFKNLKIIYRLQKKPGLVAAANLALSISQSRLFVRIDDDVEVDKNWFKNILLTFRLDKKIGAVTGPTLLTEKGIASRDVTKVLETTRKSQNIFLHFFYSFYNYYLCENKLYEVAKFFKSGAFSIGSNFKTSLKLKSREVENLEACNFASLTGILKQIGGFDQTFSQGLGEYHEADVAFKIRKLAWKIIFNPKVKLWHRLESSPVEIRPDSLNRLKNFIFFYKRHIGFKNLDYFFRFAANVCCQVSYHIYKSLFRKKS